MKSSQVSVTVIIPTYNRARYLPSSVTSVLDQTCPPVQVMVVDDGSTDSTRDVVEPFKDRIEYLYKPNGGKPSAINYALPHAVGDYIWVFDDDDVACQDALERHVGLLEKRPDLAFSCGGSYRCVDGRNPEADILEVKTVNPVRPFPEGEYLIELLLSCYTASPAVVVRRSVQEKAGCYREDLHRSQDFDMAARWALTGPAGRLEDPRPTYYRRDHDGLRGPAHGRFAYSKSVALWRRNERDILRSLEPKLSLHHYLPHEYRNSELTDQLQALALMRRLAVRLRRGLWSGAAEDIRQLRRFNVVTHPLTASSRAYLRSGLSDTNAAEELVSDRNACMALREALDQSNLELVKQDIYKGLYWLAVKAARRREWRVSRIGATVAWRLFTIRNAYDAAVAWRERQTL